MPINTVSVVRCVNTFGALFTPRALELLPVSIIGTGGIVRVLAEGDDG